MGSYILLIDCKDRAGLVYNITQVLYKNDFNILSNGEFVERDKEKFFMRTEFAGEGNSDVLLNELNDALPKDVNIKLVRKKKKNIVILVTKEHHCLGDLLVMNHYNEFDSNILAVISNHRDLEGLTKKFDIPFHFVSHENLTREKHEEKILKLIKGYTPEYIVLAKYMRILSRNFLLNFDNNVINIHHSFLPAFIGANPYRQAFDRGVKIIGATAHFVTADLDQGPIISQDIVPVDHTHSPEDMMKAGRNVEKTVLTESLKLVFEERVFISGNKTIIFE